MIGKRLEEWQGAMGPHSKWAYYVPRVHKYVPEEGMFKMKPKVLKEAS